MHYHKELATSIPSDEYFVKHMEQCWNVTEDSDKAVTIERVNEMVKTLRSKLIVKSNGKLEEYTMRNTFRNFDRDGNNVLTPVELKGILSNFAILHSEAELCALFKRLDLNNSGCIEFEEFIEFVMENAFK
jgi:Ca2+-binding EF-hand superfamily protein